MWEPEDSIPDLVVISLGGNDYNHQGGNVPSDAEFSAGYEELLLKIFTQNIVLCFRYAPFPNSGDL